MINFNDYRDEHGSIDWKAYHKAEVAAGEACETCGHPFLYPKGVSAQCSACVAMQASADETVHNAYIRCPKCKHAWCAADAGCDTPELYEEGSAAVTCPECDHEFEVEVLVTYTYTSPALLDQ